MVGVRQNQDDQSLNLPPDESVEKIPADNRENIVLRCSIYKQNIFLTLAAISIAQMFKLYLSSPSGGEIQEGLPLQNTDETTLKVCIQYNDMVTNKMLCIWNVAL